MTSTSETQDSTPIQGFSRVSRVFGDRGATGSTTRPQRSLRQRLRMPLMLAGPLVVVLGAGWWYLTTGRYVSTDDAYVQAARTMISTDVSGRVTSIAVHDNQRVEKGQLLFQLDDRPFRIAVEDAKAQLAAARLQVTGYRATYRQRSADEKAAEATLSYQQREYDRQRQLAATGVATRSTFDQVSNAVDMAHQKVLSAQADLANSLSQLAGNPDLPVEQHPAVQRAQAALDKAELDWSYTSVHAAEPGIVTKVDQLQVGSYVTASTPVFSMMSDRVWVEANFKETELTHMRPGQQATIDIDTYPDANCTGTVDSLSPGTGLSFSLLPPENATGNWVKVVQRLPVRLVLNCADKNLPLQAGLSATVEIDTHHPRPWLTWLKGLTGAAHAGETRH